MGDAIAKHRDAFQAHARKLISDIQERGGAEIADEFALPFVIGCLSIIYNRPQDFEEWLSWGPDVWTAESYSKAKQSGQKAEHVRSGSTLQAYLDRVFGAAEAERVVDPERQDVWDFVSQIELEGVRITRKEMQGIANVLLAGGRDTVIKLVTGLVWHLTTHPEDREFLKENPDWFNRTIAEMVRYLTPLPGMERVKDGEYVLLSFVSANYDKDIWPDPEVLNIHRERKPHLAFGFGRHSCMGMNITEHEAGALLSVLVNEWPGWQLSGEPEIAWAEAHDKNGETIRFIDRFDALRVC
jgi:cytochrome P450